MSMNPEVIAAVLALVGTIIGSGGGILVSSKLTNYRLQQLENKVAEHNQYARRMPVVEEQIKVINHRVSDLENYEHYNWTRYYALNLHSVFYRGTLEWRCFESTLHAGKVRANITLALAISAQAINQSRTVMRKTEISENPAFTFRTFLLRLGLIGPEYKNVREHLLENLPGDRAWRYEKSQYPSLQSRKQEER